MNAKAIIEPNGIVINPKRTNGWSTHETPAVHGAIVSGRICQTSKL